MSEPGQRAMGKLVELGNDRKNEFEMNIPESLDHLYK